MCGRYQFSLEQPTLRELWERAQRMFPEVKMEAGEIFPTYTVPVLVGNREAIEPQPVKWGFPHFKGSGVIINARSETAAEKRMFRNSLESKRCVIPTSGFFEWSSDKTKYLFQRPTSKVLYLAGLYNDYDGERRFVILTKAANSSMADIHDRMPVVLQEDEIKTWIEDNSQTGRLLMQDTVLEREVEGCIQQSLFDS